jgi:hypothetical protein
LRHVNTDGFQLYRHLVVEHGSNDSFNLGIDGGYLYGYADGKWLHERTGIRNSSAKGDTNGPGSRGSQQLRHVNTDGIRIYGHLAVEHRGFNGFDLGINGGHLYGDADSKWLHEHSGIGHGGTGDNTFSTNIIGNPADLCSAHGEHYGDGTIERGLYLYLERGHLYYEHDLQRTNVRYLYGDCQKQCRVYIEWNGGNDHARGIHTFYSWLY